MALEVDGAFESVSGVADAELDLGVLPTDNFAVTT